MTTSPTSATRPRVSRCSYGTDTARRPTAQSGSDCSSGSTTRSPPARDVFEALPDLEVIQLTSAGVEPWLPVVPAGVRLCNGRGIHGGSTAELAFAGLLAVLRDLPAYRAGQQRHAWDRWQTESLDGLRVMVIGAGDIGDRIAAAARVFDAETTMVARTARDGVRAMGEVPALLPEHDVVALALPLTDESRGLVDRAFLAAMPDGAVLVNIARGAIVDTDALLAELTSGRLRAFLDVTDPEPLPAGHPLWDAPNVLLTPHVGGGTKGWERRAYRLVRRQVEQAARRRGPRERGHAGLLAPPAALRGQVWRRAAPSRAAVRRWLRRSGAGARAGCRAGAPSRSRAPRRSRAHAPTARARCPTRRCGSRAGPVPGFRPARRRSPSALCRTRWRREMSSNARRGPRATPVAPKCDEPDRSVLPVLASARGMTPKRTNMTIR